MNQKIRIFTAVKLLVLAGIALAQEKPPIIIRPKAAEEAHVAVAEFQSKNKNDVTPALTDALNTLNTILWDDVTFAGWFTVENRALYPTTPISEPDQIKFAEWKKSPLAVDFLAIGNAKIQGNDLVVEARLYDVKTQAQVVGRKYTSTLDRVRYLAHNFADEIVYYLTAGASRGVASTQIAFVSKRTGFKEIYTMDYDGANQKALTNDRDINITPAWSHDNAKIAYTSWRTKYPEINVKAILGGVRLSFPSFRSMASSPDYSPDGRSIAFSVRSPETGLPNLFVANVDGSKRVNITNSSSVDTSPSWSPTSRQIVFISDRTGPPQLFMIDADGTNLKQLTFDQGSVDSPDWSPDGRYIVYTWRPKQAPYFDLYMMDLTTSKVYQLTANSRGNENPSWAPDGRHISFQSNREGSDQIYVMVSDGTGVRKLTNGGGSNEAPNWSNYPPK